MLSLSVRLCTHFLLLLQAHTLSQTYRCFAMRVLRAYNYRPLLLFVYITCGIRPIPIYWWALLKLEIFEHQAHIEHVCKAQCAHNLLFYLWFALEHTLISINRIQIKQNVQKPIAHCALCVDENWPGRKFVIKMMDQNKFFCCSVHLLIYILEFFWCVCSCAHFF